MNDDDINYEVRFAFFKGISTNQHSYMCDFHQLVYGPDKIKYRVVIGCFDTSNIIADIDRDSKNVWYVMQATRPLPHELELKLLEAIAEHEK